MFILFVIGSLLGIVCFALCGDCRLLFVVRLCVVVIRVDLFGVAVLSDVCCLPCVVRWLLFDGWFLCVLCVVCC